MKCNPYGQKEEQPSAWTTFLLPCSFTSGDTIRVDNRGYYRVHGEGVKSVQTRTHTEGGEWEGPHIMKVKGVEDYILGNSAEQSNCLDHLNI